MIVMSFPKIINLKKEIFIIFLFYAIISTMVTFNLRISFAASNIINVPEDFSSISLAVENASPYDTIFVKKGMYYENILIDKPVHLLGEDVYTTVIVGTGDLNEGNVITLITNNVTLSGFTIRSAEYSDPKRYANAINIQGDNCSIIRNRIEKSFWGILCAIQSSTMISQNNITSNLKEGVRFYGGSYNKISGNYISSNQASAIAIEGYSNIISQNQIYNNTRGIGVGTSHSVIFGNFIFDHTESGLYFSGSNNIVVGNTITNNSYGIYFPPVFAAPNNNYFYHNNFLDNQKNVHVSSVHNINYWDNTEEGNYWSNYVNEYPNAKEVNNSGITDTPYSITFNGKDNYPLVEQFELDNLYPIPIALQPKKPEGGVVSLWSFEEVKPNLVTVDSIGDNHAILGSFSDGINYTPGLVPGKIGNCLSFDGWAYVYVPASPTLEIRDEITFEAWIYVKEFKNVSYNNIVIYSIREDKSFPKRIMGLAVNGLEPENNTSLPIGSIRGYVTTDVDGFNEIASTKYVVNLGEWAHVIFSRSLESGLKLLVNGEEIETKIVQGTQNPEGKLKLSTYLYFGHDANALLDEVSISNVALNYSDSTSELLILIAAIMVIIVICVILIIYLKNNLRL